MNKWLNPEQDLGNIPEGRETKVNFYYEGTTNIKEINPTCGCTQANWDKESKQISVTYMPGNVPFHLEAQGKYNSVKKIVVVDDNNSATILTFTATVTKV